MSDDGLNVIRVLFQNIEGGDRLKFDARSNISDSRAAHAIFAFARRPRSCPSSQTCSRTNACSGATRKALWKKSKS